MLSLMFAPNVNAAFKDAPYLCQLKEMPSPLIFIMGAHRSGTSLLYHLLANTNKFNYISAYDIVKYDELLFNHIYNIEEETQRDLNQQINSKTQDRLIDKIPVGADLPEEYRFILFKERVNPLIQKKTLLFTPHLTSKTYQRFVEMCQKKRFISADKPLLLKNPNDFYHNFQTIHALFPEAKFIFIHRHPLHVFNSNMLAWTLALEKKSHYLSLLDKDYERLFVSASLERVLRRAFLRSGLGHRRILSELIKGFNHYLHTISQLPPTSHISISYEALCQDPQAALNAIGQFLNLAIPLDSAKQPIKPRELPVSAKVWGCYEKKLNALKPYLSHFDYPLFP